MAIRCLFAGALTALSAVVTGAAGATQPARYSSPTWSPDGKRIAFVSDRADATRGQGDIYVMNVDGSGLRRLTDSNTGKGGLAWSPNGKWIAYQAYAYIDEVSPDGARHRRLTGYGGTQPDFSPGGRRIAYANGAAEFYSSIYVMRPDGSKKVPAALPHESESLGEPTWSPDGQKLAFGVGTAADTDLITPYLAVISQYRGRRTKYVVGRLSLSTDWSSDGRRILLVASTRHGAGYEDWRILVLDLKTKKLRDLGQHATFAARWSPNGRRILFENAGRLFVMSANGTNVHEIAPR